MNDEDDNPESMLNRESLKLSNPSRYNTDSLARTFDIGDWAMFAACINVDPETFFPDMSGNKRLDIIAIQAAKAICAECPVRTDCLDYAITHHEDLSGGIWGGLTEKERMKLRDRHRP